MSKIAVLATNPSQITPIIKMEQVAKILRHKELLYGRVNTQNKIAFVIMVIMGFFADKYTPLLIIKYKKSTPHCVHFGHLKFFLEKNSSRKSFIAKIRKAFEIK